MCVRGAQKKRKEARRRPARLAERAKMIGTREKEKEKEGGGLKRISAAIAAAADFQTMRRASGAERSIAFRGEDSSTKIARIPRRREREEKMLEEEYEGVQKGESSILRICDSDAACNFIFLL